MSSVLLGALAVVAIPVGFVAAVVLMVVLITWAERICDWLFRKGILRE